MFKRLVIVAVLFACCATLLAREESLEQLKAQVTSAKPDDQPKIYVKIAELELKNVNTAFDGGDTQAGQVKLQDLTAACENAAKTSMATRKHMKQTEIALRKVSDRLEEIRKAVEFESRPPLQTAAERVEKARSDLLDAMFKK